MTVARSVLVVLGEVLLVILLVGCGTVAPGEVSVTPTVQASGATSGPQKTATAAPTGEHGRAAPTVTPAGIDLTTPLNEADCPVTGLEEFQACDGAVCIRAASMETVVNERHKILWLPQNGFRGKLTVQAERYGGGKTLRQVLEDTPSPPEPDYPSVWQFPTAGCWRLTAMAGKDSGSVAVWVR